MTRIRVLLVDDEPLARRGIRDLLVNEPDFVVVGESGDGAAALAAIRSLSPALVFLDIEMPGMNGFDLLARVEGDLPAVVFVTAYDRFAVRAFDVHAVDYLLKPVDPTRFRVTLARVRNGVTGSDAPAATDRMSQLLTDLARDGRMPDRFVVKTGGKIRLVPVDQVRWFEAAGNYVRLHTGAGRHSIRETMEGLERRLPGHKFLRIHRSYMVNLDHVAEIRHHTGDDLEVRLLGGIALPISRSYRIGLERRLGQPR